MAVYMKNYGSHSKSCRPCSTTSCNTTGEQATTDIFINLRVEPNERDALQKHERTGRPLGGNGFISQLEARTGRMLKKENRPKRAKETTIILYHAPELWCPPNSRTRTQLFSPRTGVKQRKPSFNNIYRKA